MVLYAPDPTTGEVLHRGRVRSENPKYRQQEDTETVHIRGHLWTDNKTFAQSDRSNTYSIAGGLSDVDSPMKTFSRFVHVPKKAKAGQPTPITGLAWLGGLRLVS
jgi:hypothetical protein